MQEFFDNLLGVPGITDIIAQAFGIIGMIIIISSFQCRSNKTFFLMQGTGSSMFVINFLLIGAFGGAFFNFANLIRGLLFSKNSTRKWKLALVEALYIVCFAVSCFLNSDPWQIVLTSIPCIGLLIISIFMYQGEPRRIRYAQIACSSPAWIIHNIFNFSLGGLICECFNMVSSAIFLIREKKSRGEQKTE